jgi:hypothetical protein
MEQEFVIIVPLLAANSLTENSKPDANTAVLLTGFAVTDLKQFLAIG